MNYTPHPYQKKAIRFVLENARGALWLDMGLGKSSIILAAFKILLEKGYVKRALIVAPLRVCWTVWPEEVKKWADFNGLRVEVLHGPKKEEALYRDADIYLINPDGLEWLALDNRAKRLGADMLVIDESDMAKNPKSLRFRLLKTMLPLFRRRYLLTGTPAPNGLMDLFGQIYILDEGNALGRFITHFRLSYFDATGYGGYTYLPKEGAAEAIYEKLRPLTLRMAAEDYLELPERIDNIISVRLPDKAWKTYYELENTFITILDNGEALTAPSAAVASMKLRQLVNGNIYRDLSNRQDAKVKSEQWVRFHDAKLDALEEVVEANAGKPVFVAYEFEHDMAAIRKRFKQAVFLSDFGKGEKMLEVIGAWNRGEIPMLCVHPQSAGHGINAQKGGNIVIWYSVPWNLALYQQLNARILRQGNTHKNVIVHHIIAKGTVDEAVMRALRSKDKTQADLLAALREFINEHQ